MTDQPIAQPLKALRAAIHRVLWWRRYLILLTVYLFAAGAFLLAARWYEVSVNLMLTVTASGALLLLLPAWKQARDRLPADLALTALLDHHNQSGGLVMALSETSGDWTVPTLHLPQVHFADKSPLSKLGLAGCFLMACCLVPTQWLTQPVAPGPDLGSLTQQLEEKIELLEETTLVPEEETEKLSEAVEELATTRDDQVGATWEALDYVEARVQQQANEAANKLEKMQQELANLQALSEALGKNTGSEQFNKAVEEMNRLTQNLAENNPLLAGITSQEMAEMNGQQQLDALKKALSLSQEEAQKLANKLAQAGAQSKPGQPGDQQLAKGMKDLQKFLDEHQGQDAACQSMAACLGKPGVSRGRADAPMTWKNPSGMEGADFKEQSLPPGALDSTDDPRLIGMDATAPEENGRVDSQFDALNGATTGSSGANTHTILPRHRDAVRRFFQKDKE